VPEQSSTVVQGGKFDRIYMRINQLGWADHNTENAVDIKHYIKAFEGTLKS
jgi:hypothetical protein